MHHRSSRDNKELYRENERRGMGVYGRRVRRRREERCCIIDENVEYQRAAVNWIVCGGGSECRLSESIIVIASFSYRRPPSTCCLRHCIALLYLYMNNSELFNAFVVCMALCHVWMSAIDYIANVYCLTIKVGVFNTLY